jgi:polysaccharide chain length determinant protein (PEP-CTERM system associated)
MSVAMDQFFEEVRGAWRYRWAALVTAFVVAILGWVVVFALPDNYEAEARIFVDTRTALKPVLEGLVVGQDVEAQLNLVRQSLLAGPRLLQIAESSGVLTAKDTDPQIRARKLTDMVGRVTLTVTTAAGDKAPTDSARNGAGSLYGITYHESDRLRALKVVQILLTTLVEQTLGGKRESSENAQKFLGVQIKDYEERLRAAEERLADFKKRNVGLMPTELGGYFNQLQLELDASKKSEADLITASSRRAELEKQLRGDTAITATAVTPTVGGVAGVGGSGDTVSRIRDAQAHLDDLLQRFTERHPDVIAARGALEELKARRVAEIDSLRRGDSAAIAATGAGNNPVYQSIQLALNQTQIEMATLRSQLSQHQQKVSELRKRLDSAPQVEAEYAQLDRDYSVNKAQYTALLANNEKARIGEQADSAGSVRFEVVQPPTVGVTPVSPRRGLVIAGVLLASLGLGGALAYLLHFLHPVIGSARGLTELTGLAVIGVVAAAFPNQLKSVGRAEARKLAAAFGCLMVAFVVAIALNRAGVRIQLSQLG